MPFGNQSSNGASINNQIESTEKIIEDRNFKKFIVKFVPRNQATIEEATATSARLNTEIKNLAAEIAKNQAALDQATALRQKELAEFNGEEKDVLQSIGALKSAITVLGKHHAELLQVVRGGNQFF